VAFRGVFAVAAKNSRTAECHAVIKGDIIADFSRFADNNAHSVVNKESFPDSRAGVNLHAGQKTGT
jgi:hypothetical protein